MKRLLLIPALILAGCASSDVETARERSDFPAAPDGINAVVVRTTPEPPPVIVVPPPPPPPLIALPPDTCGARPLQYLVGRPRTEIPVPVDTSNRRVTCATCPITRDLREDRLNIFYDADSGIIEEVKCG